MKSKHLVLRFAVAIVIVGFAAPQRLAAHEPCPPIWHANLLSSSATTYVPQITGVLPTVPFTPTSYRHKRGPLDFYPWYRPLQTETNYAGHRWQWINAGIKISCHVVWIGYEWLYANKEGFEGNSVLVPSWSGPDNEETCYQAEEAGASACDEWPPGAGYIPLGGETEDEECYEIWYVWNFDGLHYEEYSGFDVCFQNGNMT